MQRQIVIDPASEVGELIEKWAREVGETPEMMLTLMVTHFELCNAPAADTSINWANEYFPTRRKS